MKTLVISRRTLYDAVWVTKRRDGKVYIAIARVVVKVGARGSHNFMYECQLTIDREASWVTVTVLADFSDACNWLLRRGRWSGEDQIELQRR